MPKRNATTELTDRNWDQEDEVEEAGTFNLADEEELKKRPKLKARRTVNTEGGRTGGGLFSGFALTPVGSMATPSSGSGLLFGTATTAQTKSNGSAQNSQMNGKDSKDNPEYLRQLKTLNNNILAWIQKHVGENPYCILTPSFRDYEKHLRDLEEKYGVHASGTTGNVPRTAEEPQKPAVSLSGSASQPAKGVSFGQSKPDTNDNTSMNSMMKASGSAEKKESKAPAFGGFSFGQSTNGSLLSQGGSFGGSSLAGSSLAGSSFGASGSSFGGLSQKPFSFASQASAGSSGTSQSQSQGEGQGAEDEEYVPPKPEVREIKEDGAVYTKRCKLFYQRDGQWVDRGVGNLHLKPTDGGRTQLIVRADTNLGNILLNILLSSTLPTKKQGKNNVFLVCVPNPPINQKDDSSAPVPMLIRVKTSEDADELLAKLEECKESG
ncbi:hypothetical protein BaRGS_00035615 [Batillaria attramentaria]|uniref:RanBD1 domain-containing protein n=1 Tax=Batillaria attramentaria TaxID=370345 RepID=A0ABD0JFH8_9CAEN